MSFLFGGDEQQVQFQPQNASGGGLTVRSNGGTTSVTSSAARTGLIGQISDTFGRAAGATEGLLPRVAPGFSALRSSMLSRVEDARRSSIGNLRDNLARRRVLGSSFGEDAISRADAEFARQKADVEAQTFLQELDLTNKLQQQAFEQRRGSFQVNLDELNLEAGIATKMAGLVTEQLGANARLEAQLDAQAQAGAGKFFGGLLGPLINPTIGGIGKAAAGAFGLPV